MAKPPGVNKTRADFMLGTPKSQWFPVFEDWEDDWHSEYSFSGLYQARKDLSFLDQELQERLALNNTPEKIRERQEQALLKAAKNLPLVSEPPTIEEWDAEHARLLKQIRKQLKLDEDYHPGVVHVDKSGSISALWICFFLTVVLGSLLIWGVAVTPMITGLVLVTVALGIIFNLIMGFK
jgi:hypothetical protein